MKRVLAVILLVLLSFGVVAQNAPVIEEVFQEHAPKIEEITQQRVENDCLFYFYGVDCDDCEATSKYLEQLQLRYPQLKIDRFEVYQNRDNFALLEEFFLNNNIPAESQAVPIVFLPESYFVGEKTITSLLADAIISNKNTACPVAGSEMFGVVGKGEPSDVLQAFSFASVSGAGLANAFAPAMVAILLLLLLGTLLEPQRLFQRGMLFLGGVFLSYVLFGFGLLSGLANTTITIGFTKLVAVGAVIAGALKVREFFHKPKQWVSDKWRAQILNPLTVFVGGAVVAILSFASARIELVTLQMLIADQATRWVTWPMLIYYIFVMLILCIIALLVLYVVHFEIRHKAGEKKNTEVWKTHFHKILHFFVALFCLIAGFILLLV